MRRHLMWVLALAVAASIAAAGIVLAAAEPPTIVRAGNLVATLDGGLTPHALPRKRPAPIRFVDIDRFATVDGSQPPALEEVVLDADRNAFVDVKGLPACKRSQLEAVDSTHAKRACGDAIVGTGAVKVRVAFPEQTPFYATGPLTFFNGGERDGVITEYVHAYVSVPAPTAIVAAIEISREPSGRLANHVVVAVPRVAGGAGSVIDVEFYNHRLFTYRGKRRSFLSARCADGHFIARGTFDFHGGTRLIGSVTRSCTPVG